MRNVTNASAVNLSALQKTAELAARDLRAKNKAFKKAKDDLAKSEELHVAAQKSLLAGVEAVTQATKTFNL